MGLDLDTDETFETEITRRDNPLRAYVTIIEGCDYACSYCVVPHTRGPERSRPSEAVLSEARRLAEAGYTEIQLLGQTVNSYRDPSPRKLSFVELLREVAAVEGIRRVRFTTSHPNDFHREIVEAIDSTPGLCDHIHLPVQSGSTPHSPRNAPHLHARGVSREDFLDSRRATARSASRPTSSSAFPARPKRTSRNASPCSTRSATTAFTPSRIRRARIRRPRPCPTRFPKKRSLAPRHPAGSPAPDSDRAQRKTVGRPSSDGGRRHAARGAVGRTHHQQPARKFHFAASKSSGRICSGREVHARRRRISLVGEQATLRSKFDSPAEATMELEVKIRGLMMDP